MGAAGVLRPFMDEQPKEAPVPTDPVADAFALAQKRIGVGLKLPRLMDQLPDDVRASLDVAIRDGNYSQAHMARAVNLILEKYGVTERVTYNTVQAYREHLRGRR